MMKLERREGAQTVACGLEAGGLEDCWRLTSVLSVLRLEDDRDKEGNAGQWSSTCVRAPLSSPLHSFHPADGLHLEPHPDSSHLLKSDLVDSSSMCFCSVLWIKPLCPTSLSLHLCTIHSFIRSANAY